MIACILPTRGMVFTETEIFLEKLRLDQGVKVYRSSDLEIPDAQNELVEQALNDRISHLFFIEEDVVPPDDVLSKLLEADADIACMDYGVNGWSCVTKDKKTNEIMWCGFGSTLVKREVFEKLYKPWFRTDKTLRLNDWTWIETNPDKVYGQQDIWFCMSARDKGFRIVQVEGECRHLKLDKLGLPGFNKGLHKIIDKPKISKYNIVEKPKDY